MVIAQANVLAQPAIQWDKTIGSTGSEQLSSVLQSTDGGYILTGTSGAAGIGGDRTEPTTGDDEAWMVKLGPAGTKIWDDILDQYGITRVISTIQTTDGGFVIAGGSEVLDFLLKLDAARNVQWFYPFSPDNEFFTYTNLVEIAATTDGGFVAALTSNGRIQAGQKDENPIGGLDYLIIKFSASGAIQWNNTIGGTGQDYCSTIRQTADGGYIVAGTSSSGIGFDKTEAPKLGTDLWIVKLNANGVVVWDKTIGGPTVQSIIQSADGGYIAGGYSNTNAGGDKSENSKGGYDMWIVKLDPAGSVVWDRTIGGSGNDYVYGLFENPDGSIILGGQSDSGIGETRQKQAGNRLIYG
ncbi:hypothetical protein GCM10011325_02810 [Dyadobacter sediminis]|nr:hypothetical protein GCM10011325_02810 [Dyadobacter sediminis]